MTVAVVTVAVLILLYAVLRAVSHRERRALAISRATKFTPWKQRLRLKQWEDDNLPGFHERIAVVSDFLPTETFNLLRTKVLALTSIERSLIPAHKKGGTIGYDKLHDPAPEVVTLYQSTELQDFCSKLVGETLVPTPADDQSSCSILFYDQPGDRIGWHYDHNFYRGRHFTLLLILENRHLSESRLSSAELQTKRHGSVHPIPTPPNTLVVFEGARVRHRVTRLCGDERRILVSMTFCTNPSAYFFQDFGRRIKDTAYFGIRALWA